MKNFFLSVLPALGTLLLIPATSRSQNEIRVDSFKVNCPGGITLAGQIDYPARPGKYPAVMLVWGNGPHTRDVEISGSPLYRQISEYLVQQGMVVLRMDKRGFGLSTASVTKAEGNYSTQDLVNDFKQVFELLKNHPATDSSRIGLIGHSEGSIIVPMLLTQQNGFSWGIVYGPVGVSGADIVREQTRHNRKKMGMSEETSNAVGKAWNEYISFIQQGYQNDSLYFEIGRRFLIAHGLAKDDKRITLEFINQLLDEYKSPWYQYFFSHNVADQLRQIRVPFLVLFGANDVQTTVEQNFDPVYEALKESENKHFRIVVLADEDHFFARYEDRQMQKHLYGKMEISQRLLTQFRNWLAEIGVLTTPLTEFH